MDKKLIDSFENVLINALGQENVYRNANEDDISLKGSEDFAYFTSEIPSFTAAIPAGYREDKTYSSQMHSPNVMFDEDALPVGCGVYTCCTLEFLKG